MTDQPQPKRRGRPRKTQQAFAPQLDSKGDPVTIKTDTGDELVQREFSIRGEVGQKKLPGKRIRVYNKRGSKLFTSDGYLDANAEGSILESDMQIPGIAANCVRLA